MGGGRGIGRATALLLASRGWRVAVGTRSDPADADALRSGLGPASSLRRCDATDERSLDAWLRAVDADHGRPDALVHAAGPFHRTDDGCGDATLWKRAHDDNVLPVLRTCGRLVPAMCAAGWGRVVLFGHAGASTLRPPPSIAAWYAAKASVLAYARALAAQTAGSGVTVNCITPGVLDTGGMDASLFARMAATVPGGAPGRAEDAAALVAWLLSEEAGHVTGAELCVAGGWDLPRSRGR